LLQSILNSSLSLILAEKPALMHSFSMPNSQNKQTVSAGRKMQKGFASVRAAQQNSRSIPVKEMDYDENPTDYPRRLRQAEAGTRLSLAGRSA
jgi:hypothetical protein